MSRQELYYEAKKYGNPKYTTSSKAYLSNFIEYYKPSFTEKDGYTLLKFGDFTSQARQDILDHFSSFDELKVNGEPTSLKNLTRKIKEIATKQGRSDGLYNVEISVNTDILRPADNRSVLVFTTLSNEQFNNDYRHISGVVRDILSENDLSQVYRIQAKALINNRLQEKTYKTHSKNIEEDLLDLNKHLNSMTYSSYPHEFRFVFRPPESQVNGPLFDGDINCLVKIVSIWGREGYKKTFNKIITKFPQFEKNNPGCPVELAPSILKIGDMKAEVFTELGSIIGKHWYEINTTKRKNKKIKILSTNGHAQKIEQYVPCHSVVYSLENRKEFLDISMSGKDWFIHHNGGNPVMHKSYKPSSLTNNPRDDQNPEFFRLHSDIGLFNALFHKKYQLEPTSNYIDTIKKSERFIGFKTIKPLTTNLVEIDNIKNYASWKTSPHYIGFPKNKWFVTKGDPLVSSGMKPAFVTIESIVFDDTPLGNKWRQANNMCSDINGVLTYPEYKVLRNHATIVVNDTIYSDFQDIDIVEFANSFNIDELNKKSLRNITIGKLISGGLKEMENKHIYTNSAIEYQQMKFECDQNNITYKENENFLEEYELIVQIPKNNRTGCFHVHSYILSYARIRMMEKFVENKVYGFHVDSLLIEDDNGIDETHLGGWKYNRTPSSSYKDLDIYDLDHLPNITPLDLNSRVWEYPITDKLVIIGPAGTGKTYNFLSNPLPNQVLLEYTIPLRDAKIQEFPDQNIMTMQKYFLPGFDLEKANEIRSRRPTFTNIVIDEYCMMSPKELERVLHISSKENSNIILLGDPCQICNEIEGKINPEELGFTIHIQDRTDFARHDKETGLRLDKLRDKSPTEQLNLVQNLGIPKIKELEALKLSFTKNIKIVTGNHQRASTLNKTIKKYAKNVEIRVRNITNKKIKMVNIKDPKIWWDKTLMAQDPGSMKYLPTWVETIDSVQGQTLDNLIIDVNYLTRHGTLYTALTRTKKLDQMFLLV